MTQVDLNKYKQFVEAVTAQQSNETAIIHHKVEQIEHMALLLTGSIGIASEGGETSEIVKMYSRLIGFIQFTKRELGDIVVLMNCRALTDPNEVIDENE